MTHSERVRFRRRRWRLPLPLRVIRRPIVWWMLTAIVAAVVATTINRLYEDAEAARQAWGTTTDVLVAAVPIQPGDLIAERTTVQQWPTALVPPSAVSEPDGSARAVGPIAVGEVVTTTRIGPGEGLSARVPKGRSALALSTSLIPAGLGVGDRIDLAASFPNRREPETTIVATGAVVIDVSDDELAVAVTADEVGPTAQAISSGIVTVLIKSNAEAENACLQRSRGEVCE